MLTKGQKPRILCVIGTRPEAIKMAPVILEIKKHDNMNVYVINTAQHRKLIDDVLSLFQITPDFDLNVMQENQSLSSLTGNLFLKLNDLVNDKKYELVLSQGDTTSTLVAAQVSFYNRIPFGHIEAGLRTFDILNPFPEEMNRMFISKLATLHFAPTDIEKGILTREGVSQNYIHVTGNTVIDSLRYWSNKNTAMPIDIPTNKKIILLTLHRREIFGETLREIFSAFVEIANQHQDVHIVYPVHPNPNVNDLAYSIMNNCASISLINPLPYDKFVTLLKYSYLICTDSGGLQEESSFLNKPLLILRKETERPLVVSLGVAKLVGTNKQDIINTVNKILKNPHDYQAMQKNISPYGDGYSAKRIVDIVQHHWG